MIEPAPWHTALVLALTGERMDLGDQDGPDLDAVVELVEGRRIGHFGVPEDLMSRLPAAQFAAVLVTLRRRLTVDQVRAPGRRTLDEHDRRLAADRPPHWG